MVVDVVWLATRTEPFTTGGWQVGLVCGSVVVQTQDFADFGGGGDGD